MLAASLTHVLLKNMVKLWMNGLGKASVSNLWDCPTQAFIRRATKTAQSSSAPRGKSHCRDFIAMPSNLTCCAFSLSRWGRHGFHTERMSTGLACSTHHRPTCSVNLSWKKCGIHNKHGVQTQNELYGFQMISRAELLLNANAFLVVLPQADSSLHFSQFADIPKRDFRWDG